jgi:polar amino acid transport system permease protein
MTFAHVDQTNPHESAPILKISVRGWRDFPYWLAVIGLILVWMVQKILTNEEYRDAWDYIVPGLRLTVEVTVISFLIAMTLGVLAGLGRIARNVVVRNVALTYIEFIRGVPILVLIYTVAFVVVPWAAESFGFQNNSVDFKWRAIVALALIYGAYLAEVFRAGIESVPAGQSEAGRSLGMTHTQTLRKIVLPQAVRNMTPAIGNDLIAMLKDSSLVSVLAVREITQRGRLHANSTFDFRETYLVLTICYLTLTIALSLLLSWYRRRLGMDE